MSLNNHVYELIIIGAGPAGITAAIYAARKKMDYAKKILGAYGKKN